MSNEREGLREVLREIAAEAWRARDEAEEAIAFEAGESRILSILTQAQGYPYEDDNGTTHWEGCWRERGHHNCAVAMVERLTQAQEPVAWRLECAEANLSVLRMVEPRAENYPAHEGWTITPLYASPVASAPEEKLADVAGRMKAYGYDAETLRVLTEHIFGGAEIPMPSAPEPYDASKEPIALPQAEEPVGYVVRLNPSAGSPLPWMFRERGQQLPPSNDGWEVVPVYTEPVGTSPVASAPVWPEPGAPAPATKPPLGKIRPSAPEEEREAFDPLTCLPGEYEIGRAIREVANHDPERMRFYLTCSIGELAQRIARLRATQREEGEADG